MLPLCFPEESSLFSLFQISLQNFFKIETQLLYHLRLQPSEISQMPYYELEYILENLIDILEKKKEAEEGNDEEMQERKSSMMSDAKRMMPGGMPNVSSSGKMSGMPSLPSSPSMPSFPSIPSNLKI